MNQGHAQCCSSDEWREEIRNTVLPAILGATELGPDVLELGPGYGATTEVLREQVDRLTAIEIHAGLAARLVERFIGMNVEVVVGDATDLTLQDNRFSAAVSFFMLHHVPSQQQQDRVFAEVTRLLQPGGLFVVADSLASDDLLEFHKGDIYVPIDPAVLADRLTIAGLVAVTVRVDEDYWHATASKPASP